MNASDTNMSDKKPSDSRNIASSQNPNSRRRSRRVNPDAIRTEIMKHVVAFGALMVFFVISVIVESGKGGSVSDWPVIIYLILGAMVYGLALFLYPIVHRAWIDSAR